MNEKGKYQMMLETPIPPLIGKLAVPTIISMLVTSFYNMADTFFVGKLGTSATAAVGVAFPVMAVIQALGFFCGHGSGNSISRKLGAQQNESAGELAATGFYGGLLLGCLVLTAGFLFLTPLSRLLGSTDTILPYTEEYLRIILIGAPFMTSQFVLNNQIRFQGNALFAMIGVGTGAALNIILDPVLIFHFHLGISGAALATIISQFVGFLLLLAGVHFSSCVPIRLKNVRFNRKRLIEIAGGGLPSLFRQGLGSVATMTLNIAANPYGDAAIAAMSVVSRINLFAISALIGFGQGFQPVCGFNYGAKKYSRVREAFWFCVKVSTVFLLFVAILGYLFSGHLIGIFRDDPKVIQIGTTALRFQCATLILNGWVIMNNMMTQTMGKTLYATLLASARQGLFFIPALLVLPRVVGLLGIQMAQATADVCSMILSLVIYRLVMNDLEKEEAQNAKLVGKMP